MLSGFCAKLSFEQGRLEADSQPVGHGYLSIWFDGYLSNADDLIELLGAASEATDCDLVGLSYMKWKEQASAKLEGDYSLLVFDSREKQLLLAHDQLGLRPLFYAKETDGFLIGSRLETMYPRLSQCDLSDDFVADYLSTSEPWGERTPFKQISRLLPGEAMLLRATHIQHLAVWDLDDVGETKLSQAEQAEALLENIARSISAACRGKNNIFCQLSGGLDSSTVACVAHKNLNIDLDLVSLVHPKSYQADESQWMQEVISQYPANWWQIDGDACLPFNGKADRILGEPSEVGLWPLWDQAYADILHDKKADVLLTGEGGDVALLGDHPQPYFLADRFAHGQWSGLPRAINLWAVQSRGQRSPLYGLSQYIMKPIFNQFAKRPLDYKPDQVQWIDGEFARRTNIRRRGAETWLPKAGSMADGLTLQRLVLMGRIMSTLPYQKKTSTPIRHPLLDIRIVRFMLSIAWPEKIDPRKDRITHRRAMQNILPEAIRVRDSKGGSDQTWVEGLAKGKAWRERLGDNPHMASMGYVDLTAWRKAIDQASVARTDQHRFFDRSAAMESWLDNYYSIEPTQQPMRWSIEI